MNTKVKRLLVILLIVSMLLPQQALLIFAQSSKEATGAQNEQVTEQQTEQKEQTEQAEQAEAKDSAQKESTEAAAEEQAKEESSKAAEEPKKTESSDADAKEAGQTEKVEKTEAVTEATDQEKAAEEIKYPAQNFRDKASNGANVVVKAGEGAFPEGTTMVVRAIGDRRAQAIAEKTVSENETVTDAIAVDISFLDKNGSEIEPADGKKVSVSITLDNALDGDNFLVIHQNDDGDASVIAEATESKANFSSESFSIYVVAAVEETTPRLEVRFFMPGESKPYNTQFVASGDDLHDPGADLNNMTEDEVFAGWNVDGTEVPDLDGLNNLIPDSFHSGEKMDVTAVIHVERRLVYERLDGRIKHSEDYIVPKNPGTKDVVVNQSYTPSAANLGFVGWAVVDANGDPDETTIYKNGDTITLTKPKPSKATKSE